MVSWGSSILRNPHILQPVTFSPDVHLPGSDCRWFLDLVWQRNLTGKPNSLQLSNHGFLGIYLKPIGEPSLSLFKWSFWGYTQGYYKPQTWDSFFWLILEVSPIVGHPNITRNGLWIASQNGRFMALGLPPCSLNISLIPNYPQFALHDSRNLYEIIKPPTYIIIYIYMIGLV